MDCRPAVSSLALLPRLFAAQWHCADRGQRPCTTYYPCWPRHAVTPRGAPEALLPVALTSVFCAVPAFPCPFVAPMACVCLVWPASLHTPTLPLLVHGMACLHPAAPLQHVPLRGPPPPCASESYCGVVAVPAASTPAHPCWIVCKTAVSGRHKPPCPLDDIC